MEKIHFEPATYITNSLLVLIRKMRHHLFIWLLKIIAEKVQEKIERHHKEEKLILKYEQFTNRLYDAYTKGGMFSKSLAEALQKPELENIIFQIRNFYIPKCFKLTNQTIRFEDIEAMVYTAGRLTTFLANEYHKVIKDNPSIKDNAPKRVIVLEGQHFVYIVDSQPYPFLCFETLEMDVRAAKYVANIKDIISCYFEFLILVYLKE